MDERDRIIAQRVADYYARFGAPDCVDVVLAAIREANVNRDAEMEEEEAARKRESAHVWNSLGFLNPH